MFLYHKNYHGFAVANLPLRLMVAVCLEAKSKTLRADKMMVADPPKGMTGKPFKPPCGAAFRKGVVLNDKEKAKIIRQVRIRELNM